MNIGINNTDLIFIGQDYIVEDALGLGNNFNITVTSFKSAILDNLLYDMSDGIIQETDIVRLMDQIQDMIHREEGINGALILAIKLFRKLGSDYDKINTKNQKLKEIYKDYTLNLISLVNELLVYRAYFLLTEGHINDAQSIKLNQVTYLKALPAYNFQKNDLLVWDNLQVLIYEKQIEVDYPILIEEILLGLKNDDNLPILSEVDEELSEYEDQILLKETYGNGKIEDYPELNDQIIREDNQKESQNDGELVGELSNPYGLKDNGQVLTYNRQSTGKGPFNDVQSEEKQEANKLVELMRQKQGRKNDEDLYKRFEAMFLIGLSEDAINLCLDRLIFFLGDGKSIDLFIVNSTYIKKWGESLLSINPLINYKNGDSINLILKKIKILLGIEIISKKIKDHLIEVLMNIKKNLK